METFAQVLGELISHRELRVVDLARNAAITPSYISNLRKPGKNPRRPSHKALAGLVSALWKARVPAYDIRRLVEAAEYSWASLGRSLPPTEQGNSLPLLETLRRGIETRGIVPNKQEEAAQEEAAQVQEEERQGQGMRAPVWGEPRDLLQQVTALLQQATRTKTTQEKTGGKTRTRIFVSWFASLLHDEGALRDEQEQFVTALRSLLGPDSNWEVLHLWAGQVEKAVTIVGDVLAQFLGTSNYALYEVPGGEYLPEFLLIEGQSALIALPNPQGQYAILSLAAGKEGKESPYLVALLEYLKTLLGPDGSRPPVLQTFITEAYSLRDLAQLALAEERDPRDERLLVTSGFSAAFRPAQAMREWLRAEQEEAEKIAEYMTLHKRRVAALERRLEAGKERIIHARETLQRRFQHLAQCLAAGEHSDLSRRRAEAQLRQAQLTRVLECITTKPNFRLGLVDRLGWGAPQPPPFFELVGNIAFFQHQKDPDDFLGKQASAMAWTDHPGILFQLRHEFDAWWQEIRPVWRTDTHEGKPHVVGWIIAESLKALLQANVPPQALWPFVKAMLVAAIYQDEEEFRHALSQYEQDAKHIVIINAEFPISTMPPGLGRWPGKSSIRTRQRLLYSILREGVEKFEMIVSQPGIMRYWSENQYGKEEDRFEPDWTRKHFENVVKLLTEENSPIKIAVVPEIEFLVNFEVIDEQVVFLETSDPGKKAGMILHDEELARELTRYATEQLSARCPPRLRGSRQVAKWLAQVMSDTPGGRVADQVRTGGSTAGRVSVE